MLGVQGNHDAGELRALALVNRQHVGQGQFIQVLEVIHHLPAFEQHREFLLDPVDLFDHAQVAVKHVPIVIVLGLDDAVSNAVRPAEAFDFRPAIGRIQGRLQHLVEIARAQLPAIHGSQDLDIGPAIQSEAGGNPFPDQPYDPLLNVLRLVGLDEVEIRERLGGGQRRQLTLVDRVGRGHDPALRGLAEDLGQPHHGHDPGGD